MRIHNGYRTGRGACIRTALPVRYATHIPCVPYTEGCLRIVQRGLCVYHIREPLAHLLLRCCCSRIACAQPTSVTLAPTVVGQYWQGGKPQMGRRTVLILARHGGRHVRGHPLHSLLCSHATHRLHCMHTDYAAHRLQHAVHDNID